MRRILWLVLFALIIAAVGILMPFRVYGANLAGTRTTNFRDAAKQQLTREQSKPPKVDKKKKQYKPPQPQLPMLPQLPKSNPNFSPLFQPLHPIRHT